MSYAALCLYAAWRARRARVRCTNRAGAGRAPNAPRRKDNPMPTQNVPENAERDELEQAYLLLTSRGITRRGYDEFPYIALVIAFLMAFGALSLLGVL